MLRSRACASTPKPSTRAIEYGLQPSQLSSLTRISSARFGAKDNTGRFHGLLEAEIQEDRTITIESICHAQHTFNREADQDPTSKTKPSR